MERRGRVIDDPTNWLVTNLVDGNTPNEDTDEDTSRDALAEMIKPWNINGGYKPYKPVGCVDCRMTGYMGRMGLYELLVVSDAFKAKVTADPSIDVLRKQAITDGMRPLRLAGALRVAEGQTVIEEVLTSTPPLT